MLKTVHVLRVFQSLSSAAKPYSSWSSHDVRRAFIQFFEESHNHLFVPSSSVLPTKTQGTYFTNAGMNQFKPIFLGTTEPGSKMSRYRRVVNSQKCIRVGGKHNDLDDVGRDLTHQTFFEMLGSWSFGDYFKSEACVMALALLCDVYKIPQDRLYFTYFGGDIKLGLEPDLECCNIWLSLGIPESHVLPFGMRDNFWDMGETGPCGPCTEIHYDHIGDRNASNLVNTDSPDVVEIWNLVFMQYDRKLDCSLHQLPSYHVDTGMGLERISAVLQGSKSNYDTDLFQPLFSRIQKVSGAPPYQGKTGENDIMKIDTAYRIVSDHARMSSVAIADGLLPGRDDLEHKLRHIIHRSIKQSRDIFKAEKGFLAHVVDEVVDTLGETYPELNRDSNKIKEVLNMSEDLYDEFRAQGAKAFSKMLRKVDCSSSVSGEVVWQLYNGEYGHPVLLDMILDLAEDKGLQVDMDGFYERLEKSKEKSPGSSPGIVSTELHLPAFEHLVLHLPETDDASKYMYSRTEDVYDFSRCEDTEGEIIGVVQHTDIVQSIHPGDVCGVILDKTCFYSEGGGQMADRGQLVTQTGSFEVSDVQMFCGHVFHIGLVVEGCILTGQKATMKLDQNFRVGCMCNHTATHLLNSILQKIIGGTFQKGSDVQHDKFTFDFTSLGSVSLLQIKEIENCVRQQILGSHPVCQEELPLEEALKIDDLMKMQNETYPSQVYVIRIEQLEREKEQNTHFRSVELCGGTHVLNTVDIGDFCILRLTGVSLGTKRAMCVTGDQARQAHKNGEELVLLYEELESLVRQRENVAAWENLVRMIHQKLREELLPKVVRDTVREKLELLGQHIKAEQNKVKIMHLRQEMKDLLAEARDGYIVKQMLFSGKQMVKALAELDFDQPLALISEGKKSSVVILCLPQTENHKEDILNKMKAALGSAGQTKHSSVNYGSNKIAFTVTVKGRQLGNKLYSICQESFANHFDR